MTVFVPQKCCLEQFYSTVISESKLIARFKGGQPWGNACRDNMAEIQGSPAGDDPMVCIAAV